MWVNELLNLYTCVCIAQDVPSQGHIFLKNNFQVMNISI